jgi:hypothetical protein
MGKIEIDQETYELLLQERKQALDKLAKSVTEETYKNTLWERDMAVKQLESYGVGFCEQADVVRLPCRCNGCVFYESVGHESGLCKQWSKDGKGRADDDYCSFGIPKYSEEKADAE